MFGFEPTQGKGGIAYTHRNRLVSRIPVGNNSQWLTLYETKLQQTKSDISALNL